jgi:hypothetical protein
MSRYNIVLEHSTEWLLVLFTFFLVVFTGLLWWSTHKLWLAGERQREDARIAADRQFEINQQSIKLAREEFVSTHRPRIILREAIIGSVLEGEPVSIHFHVANIGETKGTITRNSVSVEVVSVDRLMLHPSVEVKDDLGKIELGPGGAVVLKFQGETPKWETEKFKMKAFQTTAGVIERRDLKIHFFGQLVYLDQNGISRRTAFRRELLPERQRFYRIANEPDLDYGD